MPDNIGNLPYFEVQFTKDGKRFEEASERALIEGLTRSTTDLFVVSHGWNNDMEEARSLYRELFGNIAVQLGGPNRHNLTGRTFAILGVLWPSKKFAEEDLIAGGG